MPVLGLWTLRTWVDGSHLLHTAMMRMRRSEPHVPPTCSANLGGCEPRAPLTDSDANLEVREQRAPSTCSSNLWGDGSHLLHPHALLTWGDGSQVLHPRALLTWGDGSHVHHLAKTMRRSAVPAPKTKDICTNGTTVDVHLSLKTHNVNKHYSMYQM